MADKVRAQLEREVLPSFVAGRRWYAAKGEPVRRVALADHVEWKRGEQQLADRARATPSARAASGRPTSCR